MRYNGRSEPNSWLRILLYFFLKNHGRDCLNLGWIAKRYDNVSDVSQEANKEEVLQFSNAELLLIEDALNIAQRESGQYISIGKILYKKVRGHLESQGYRFNEDGSYYHISRG